LLFIVNPVSGDVDKEPFLEKAARLCNTYGIVYEFFKTTGKDDHKKALRKYKQFKPDRVLSVGGDGTALFVAKLLLDTSCPMGIIPLGSANGMATELFVSTDPIQALKDVIMSEITADLDMIKINDQFHMLHIGDVGINAGIVSSYEKDENRGIVIYAKYFLEELTKLKPFKVSINANGKNIETDVLMVAICNARKYGTGLPLNLIGNPMDGKFEIVLIEKIDSSSLISAGLAAFDEKFYDSQINQVIQTEEAEIEFEEPRLLQLDGEILDKFQKLHVKIVKGAVSLITTRNNKYLEG
jgi:diacylglycerol kinase family enzyme